MSQKQTAVGGVELNTVRFQPQSNDPHAILTQKHVALSEELATTRSYAFVIVLGFVILTCASLGELSNIFSFTRLNYEDRYGDLTWGAIAITMLLSVSRYIAMAYSVHCGISWLKGEDEHPPLISLTIGVIALALSISFPFYISMTSGLLITSLFSLLLTVVAGLGLQAVSHGYGMRARHILSGEEIMVTSEQLLEYEGAKQAEETSTDRANENATALNMAFAQGFTAMYDASYDALMLAAHASAGMPVAPIDQTFTRMWKRAANGEELARMIEVAGDGSAIGLHKRLAGRTMHPSEAAAVRRYLATAQRPTVGEIFEEMSH